MKLPDKSNDGLVRFPMARTIPLLMVSTEYAISTG